MPAPALLLLLSTLLPLVGFAVLIFLGRRMGAPLAGYVGTTLISASFVCTILAMLSWYGGGTYAGHDWGFDRGPILMPLRWLPLSFGAAGGGAGELDESRFLHLGLFVDSLTVLLFAMVSFIAVLVHIFSIGYMRGDSRYPRFFTYLALFCFSMLGLLLGGTLLQLFVFWELIGICSFLLIGFWYEKRTAANAAVKAFVVNRIGDVGLLVGMGILLLRVGNVTLPHLWIALGSAGAGRGVVLPDGSVFSATLLTITGVALLLGAMGKSAQFPLHVWLPDAMEGPTPVSALIHAATMVAAGVYLVARLFPILTPSAKLFIAIIGVVTLTMGALVAVAQTDIKKVLAFSTISQLGYMMLALGVGSWVGGLFHLVTHAFFKALLFLAAGSVIHAAGHEQELERFGGLLRKIPVTAIAFLIGALAISGVGYGPVGFSGYYSKDMILAHAGATATLARWYGHGWGYVLLFALPTAVAFVTPFYMARCWMLTFWGRARHPAVAEEASETPLMVGPLVVLSVLAIIGGRLLNVQEMIQSSIVENTAYCRSARPDFAAFDYAWPAAVPEDRGSDTRDVADVTAFTPRVRTGNAPDAAPLSIPQRALVHGHQLVKTYLGFWNWSLGLLAGFLIYLRGPATAAALLRKIPPLRWLHLWLHERMFFDELYFSVFVSVSLAFSWLSSRIDTLLLDGVVNGLATAVRGGGALARWTDQHVVDGAVRGVAASAAGVGAAARSVQSGRIRIYILLLSAALALGLFALVVFSLAKH